MWNREFGTHWSIWVWDSAYSPFICSTGSDLAFDLPEMPEVNYVGMAGSDVFSVFRPPEEGKNISVILSCRTVGHHRMHYFTGLRRPEVYLFPLHGAGGSDAPPCLFRTVSAMRYKSLVYRK
jgi:hypothetical protein